MVSSLKQSGYWCRILLFTLIALTLIAGLHYFILYKHTLTRKTQELTTIIDQRTQEIRNLLVTQEKTIKKVLDQPDVIQSINKILEPASFFTSSDTSAATKKLEIALSSYRNLLDNKNFILFTPQGRVVFSDTPVYTNVSLEQASFRDSALGQSVAQVIMTLTTSIAEFSYDPLIKEPAFFIVVPIFKNKKLYAISAIRIREEKIQDIINNYIGLGHTGEVFVSKLIPSGILFISGVRSEALAPFKKFLPPHFSDRSGPIQQATAAKSGDGITLDYRKVLSLASWSYIPEVDWGIVARIDYKEVLATLSLYKKFFLLLLMLLIIVFFITLKKDVWLYSHMQRYTQHLQAITGDEHKLRNLLKFFWAITFIGIALSAYHSYFIKQKAITKSQESIHTEIAEVKEEIDHILYNTERITQSIVYDLGLGRLKKEDLVARLKRDLNENPAIAGISVAYAPYAYNKNTRIFGRYVTRTSNGVEIFNLDELYDYTVPRERGSFSGTFYLDTLKQTDLLWGDPRVEDLSKNLVAPCSQDFRVSAKANNDLLGVVTVFLDVNVIKKMIKTAHISTIGSMYLLSSQGNFIYYPEFDHKNEQISIATLAQSLGSSELAKVVQRAHEGVEGFYPFYDEKSSETKEIYFTPIKRADWTFGIFFAEKSILPSTATIRHNFILLLFLFTSLVICTLMLLFKTYSNNSLLATFYTTTLPLIVCQALLLYISTTYSTPETTSRTPITDAIALEQFLEEQQETAVIVQEDPPIPLPTGIEIDSIDLTTGTDIKLSGLIWQKYNNTHHKDIAREILFTESSRKTEFVKQYETPVGDTTIIGWKFFTQIPCVFDTKQYPLDTNEIAIIIEHPDAGHNVLLVPDFNDYQNISPKALPGIVDNFKLPGFSINYSLFSFEKLPQKTTYGVEPFGNATSRFELNFNLAITRDIIYSLLVFFLPIFVILFAIYAIFILSENNSLDPYKTLTGYTGLLLTIIFLHRMLRERILTGTTMYIEYFFFFTYFTLLVLILHILFKGMQFDQQAWYNQIFSFYKKFFWDIQLVYTIIITTMTFY